MNKTEKLIRNSGIYLIANFASKFLNVILVPIYTAYLQTDDFGSVNLLLLLSGVIGILFSLDITDAAYRFLLDDNADKKKIISNAIMIYWGGAIIFALVYFPFVISAGIKYGVILGFHIILTNFQVLQQQMARGMKCNKIYASAGVVMCLVQGISNIAMIVWFHIDSVSILIAPLIASVVTIIYVNAGTGIWKQVRIQEVEWKQIRALGAYGAPIGACTLFNWVISNSGTYLLTWITGTAALSGVYALATKFPAFISAFTAIFGLAWQETAVEEYGSEEYIIYYNKVLNKYFTYNFYAMALLLPMISSYFILVDTKGYASAKLIVPLLLLSSIMESMKAYVITGYYIVKRTKEISFNAFVSGMVTILLGVILIRQFGLIGLAVSVLTGQAVHFLITYFRVRKHVAYKVELKKLGIPFLVVLLSTSVYYFDNIEVQIGMFVLLGVLVAFRERALVQMLLRKLKVIKGR